MKVKNVMWKCFGSIDNGVDEFKIADEIEKSNLIEVMQKEIHNPPLCEDYSEICLYYQTFMG